MNQKTKSGKKPFLVIIIILALILSGAVVFTILRLTKPQAIGGEDMAKAEEEPVYAVNTTSAVLGPIADYFETNGDVITATSVDVYPETAGILARLYVKVGDYVRENQVIAEVDPSRPGLSYSLSPVKARISGTVTAVPLHQGDAVGLQSPVVTIGDLGKLQVIASIPERFISRIRLGMPAEISLPAWPGRTVSLTVDHLNPVVEASSRSMEIKMDIPADNSQIKAGMYAEIRLTTDDKDAVIKVPADTILRRTGEQFVYIIEDDTAYKRIVVTGITLGDVAEIIEGLAEGEKVVYQGQSLLEDKVKVNVIRDVQVID